ncbi:MAG: HAD hydrolase family protein [Mycobacteriales bacterium]
MAADIRVVYSDLDGTMVGPGGCFFRDADGAVTLDPAAALTELHAAGIALVLVSGRSLASLREAGDIFGADGFIGELGGIVAHDRGQRIEVLRGAMPSDLDGTPVEAMRRGGVLELLRDRWPGQIQLHDPWHEDHVVDLLLRGDVPVDEADDLLARHGFGWLRLNDNGVMAPGRTFDGLDVHPIRYYHLLPHGITKAIAIEADLQRRGLEPAQAIAIGDSLSDMEMAPHVAKLFIVANGESAYTPGDNVTLTGGAMGAGWAEAVRYAVAHTALGRR